MASGGTPAAASASAGAPRRLGLGVRRGHVMAVGGHRVAEDERTDAGAARPGVLRVLDDERPGALAEGEAAAGAVEGTARLGVERLEGVEACVGQAAELGGAEGGRAPRPPAAGPLR